MAEQTFQVQILPEAQQHLEALPRRIRQNIAARIDALAANPRPQMAKPIKGAKDLWRLRVGDYRVIYRLQNQELLVLVVRIGNRREVYRGL